MVASVAQVLDTTSRRVIVKWYEVLILTTRTVSFLPDDSGHVLVTPIAGLALPLVGNTIAFVSPQLAQPEMEERIISLLAQSIGCER